LFLHYDNIACPLGFMAWLSLMLCFFNLLLPIPPLDGSRIVRALIGMSHENYARFAQYGYIPVILVLQIPYVRWFIGYVTNSVYDFLNYITPGAHVWPSLWAF
jgi:membrane-associated protease RseP (regulator of RpoE activity)